MYSYWNRALKLSVGGPQQLGPQGYHVVAAQVTAVALPVSPSMDPPGFDQARSDSQRAVLGVVLVVTVSSPAAVPAKRKAACPSRSGARSGQACPSGSRSRRTRSAGRCCARRGSGRLVLTLMVPPVVFLPNRVPCGPAQYFDLFDVEHLQVLGLYVVDHEIIDGDADRGLLVHDDGGLGRRRAWRRTPT